MSLQILLFVIGLFLLLQGAQYLIDGATNIARHLRISRLVIGMTIIAIGTSTPELVVSIVAAMRGESELVFSNINGSNIVNILLMLGFTALVIKIPVQRKFITREFPYLILSSFILVVMMLNTKTLHAGALYPFEGLILIAIYIAYFIHVLRESKQVNTQAERDEARGRWWHNAIFMLLGFLGLAVGAQLVVDAAVHGAVALGISKTLIGVGMIAFGTSLPELSSAVVAARRAETDLTIGNAVGSNIFNIGIVIGSSTLFAHQPLVASRASILDAIFVFAISCLLMGMIFIRKLHQKQYVITRLEGGVLLGTLIAYLAYIVVRG